MSRQLEMQAETCPVGRRQRAVGTGGGGLDLWQLIHKKPPEIRTLAAITLLEPMDLMLGA